MFEFRKFGNWLSFPKKVVSTDKLKTGIKSEQNNFGTLFCSKFIRDRPLARNGNFFKNAVIQKKIAVTSKTIQLHIFRGLKDPSTRNDFVNDIVNDRALDAIFATLKAIVDDEKSTISSTMSLRVAGSLV